jgi:hypothetical protein
MAPPPAPLACAPGAPWGPCPYLIANPRLRVPAPRRHARAQQCAAAEPSRLPCCAAGAHTGRRPDSPARGPPGASLRHHEHPRIEPRLFHRFPSPEELQSAAAP